jgi:putative glutamine amidotransferase
VAVHPHAPGGTADPAEVESRFARFDRVLLPGGGDIAPHRYGDAETHASVHDMDDEQDGFDLAIVRHALDAGLPLLAICRGLQVVNVALGGTLHQDMGPDHEHRPRTHRVALQRGSFVEQVIGAGKVEASCFHHQRVDRVGEGLTVVARAADDTVEALDLPGARGWFVAVQWHPEDTAADDPAQQRLFDALVQAARR